jgi:AcrR family transcriptional regulator
LRASTTEKEQKNMTEARKQQEIAYRRKLIIDAARFVFFDKGFENSTMEDIARKAGYSKGSLYSYFDSKNEICFTIVNDYFSTIVELIQKISTESATGLEKLEMIRHAFIDEYSQNSQFCNIYETFKYHQGQCMDLQSERTINDSHSGRIRELITGIVQSGISDGSIRGTVDVERLSKAFWNEKNCFLAETMFTDINGYDYLFDLIIDSIKVQQIGC